MPQVNEELRVVEEFLLLVLDADHGDIRHSFPIPSRALGFAGAALMDLALERPERPLKIKLSPAPHLDDSVRMRLVHRRGD